MLLELQSAFSKVAGYNNQQCFYMLTMKKYKSKFKTSIITLAEWLTWLECHPVYQKS